MKTVTATVTAENEFTDSIKPLEEDASSGAGNLSLSISGATWSATVTLQRSIDSGVSWLDVAQWTSNVEQSIEDHTRGILYRLGVKTGDFSSGSVTCALVR